MRESNSSTAPAPEQRQSQVDRYVLAGITVREEDIESVKGIRAVALLFRSMAVILLLLMALQVFFAITSTVALSVGVVVAEAVRLVIFAGLLWGAGDLAVLWIKSHHDIRATRILVARVAHMMQQMGVAEGTLPPEGSGSRADRAS